MAVPAEWFSIRIQMFGAGHNWKSNGKFIRNRQTGEGLSVRRQVVIGEDRGKDRLFTFTRITVEMHREAAQKMAERHKRRAEREAERERKAERERR